MNFINLNLKTKSIYRFLIVLDIILTILLLILILNKYDIINLEEIKTSIESRLTKEDEEGTGDNEESSYTEEELTKEFTSDEIEHIRAQTLSNREARIDWTLKYPDDKFNTLVDVKFNSCYDNSFAENNTTLYQVASRYMNPELFVDTNFVEYIDPLYVLAISNVEFGGTNDYNKLLAPALPTRSKINITKDNILNFDYSDYLNYPELLSSDRDMYRGPLQMYVTGLKPIIKEDIHSSEFEKLIVAPDSKAKTDEFKKLCYVEGSGVSCRGDGMTLANKRGVYGDRYNYPDSVNRLAGGIHDNWIKYNQSSIEKTGDYLIKNKFTWMAISSIGHNASPGIFYMRNNKTLSSKYYWWPYASFGSARKYCIQLGDEKCYSYIQKMAEQNLKKARAGSSLKFTLTMNEGYEIAEYFKEKGYIDNSLYVCTNSGHKEKIAYPIQMLYNYFMLRLIYSGY